MSSILRPDDNNENHVFDTAVKNVEFSKNRRKFICLTELKFFLIEIQIKKKKISLILKLHSIVTFFFTKDGLEYADCIPLQKVETPNHHQKSVFRV